MTAVDQNLGYAFFEDEHGRTLSLVVDTEGGLKICIPSGTPGRLKILAKMSRDQARDFSQAILDLVGVQDS